MPLIAATVATVAVVARFYIMLFLFFSLSLWNL